MNEKELREFIESRGYEVRNIRVFKKTFHVAYRSKNLAFVAYYGVPLSSIKQDGSEAWHEFANHFKREED